MCTIHMYKFHTKQMTDKFVATGIKIVSMIRKYHNHKPQTKPWHCEKEPHNTITRHQEDKLSKATSSLFPIKMIAKLEWT